jgi:hypothetical protein
VTSSKRAGFSLMEVLVATTLLLGSMIVLSELAGLGRRHAESAQDYATAQLLCENKMSEILVGLAPLASVEAEPFETELMMDETDGLETTDGELTTIDEEFDVGEESQEEWLHSIEIESLDYPGLVSVRVTVWLSASELEEEEEPRHAFSLVRWMRSSSGMDDGLGLDLDSSYDTPSLDASPFLD